MIIVRDTSSWSDKQTNEILMKSLQPFKSYRAEGNSDCRPLTCQCDLDLRRRDMKLLRHTPSLSDTQPCEILLKSLYPFESYRAEGNSH